MGVDKDRVEGSATNLGGKVKEGVGKLTGDSKTQAEGKTDQAKGKFRMRSAASRIPSRASDPHEGGV